MSDRTGQFPNEIGKVVYNMTAASFSLFLYHGKLLIWFNQKGGGDKLKIRDCYPILFCFHACIFPTIFRFLRNGLQFSEGWDG